MADKYWDEYTLISELNRFVEENGRNPKWVEMVASAGYPARNVFTRTFGSWNKALTAAGLDINVKQIYSGVLTGNETCDNCGTTKLANNGWRYKNNQRLCHLCYYNKGYRYGNLAPDSETGFAFISQRVVAKVLDLELKDDCNCSVNFNTSYDLLDDGGYGYINVKAATNYIKRNNWNFYFQNKYIPDTYIMLAFSADKIDIKRVWITEALDDLTFEKKSISIHDSYKGLLKGKPWEVDAEPYNDAYHSMSLDNCSVLRSD